jgi:hypothetical protein
VQGLNPRALAGHHDLYRAVVLEARAPVSRKERELIATVVSSVNGCHY